MFRVCESANLQSFLNDPLNVPRRKTKAVKGFPVLKLLQLLSPFSDTNFPLGSVISVVGNGNGLTKMMLKVS